MAQQDTSRQGLRRSVQAGIGILMALAAISLPSFGPPVGAAPAPPALSSSDVNRRDSPALEFVVASAKGTVTIYQPQLNTSSLSNFARGNASIQQTIKQGDASAAIDTVLQELKSKPETYLSKGQMFGTADQQSSGFGSAWNVSSDGYLVTNAHVAGTQADLVVATLQQPGASQVVNSVVSQFTRWAGPDVSLSSQQHDLLQAIVTVYVAGTATVANFSRSITVYPDMSALGSQGYLGQVVSIGDEFPGKDVAILKTDAKNIPVISLEDDAQLSKGETVFALGFPFDATFDPNGGSIKTETLSATISPGVVSNRLKSSAADYQYIEHTATVNHGSSGGVLVNASGKAVGITTAGDTSLAANTVNNGGQFFYAVPVSVVREYLSAAKVTPTSSPDQVLYDKADDRLTQGASSHNAAQAYSYLSQVQRDGYTTPYVDNLLAKIPDSARHPVSSSRSAPVKFVAAGGAVALIGLLALFLVVLVAARRRSARPVAPTVPSPPQPPMPGASPRWSATGTEPRFPGGVGPQPPVSGAPDSQPWLAAPSGVVSAPSGAKVVPPVPPAPSFTGPSWWDAPTSQRSGEEARRPAQ